MSFDPYEFDRSMHPSGTYTLGQYTAKTFLWMMLGLLVTFGVAAIGYATDLGTVTPAIWQGLLGADLVLIESNYEPRLLAISSYPYYLRQRIASDHGHLSNPDCADTVRRLAQTGTARFVLAHLSRENNTPELAAAHGVRQYAPAFGWDYLTEQLAGLDFQAGGEPDKTSP